MASIERQSGRQISHIMMGTGGTSGDLMYRSTGSGLTYKSASTGTAVAKDFIGVLVDSAAAGSFGAVSCNGVFDLEKHAATQVIEVGDLIYGTKSSNKVGTVAKGTALGVCIDQSGSTDTYVSVRIIPFFEMGVSGYHA